MKRRTALFLFVAVLLLGLSLRLRGLLFGMPWFPGRDEPFVVEKALRFGTGDLNPHAFVNPSFYLYLSFALDIAYFLMGRLVGHFGEVADFKQAFFLDPTPIYLLTRSMTVLLGGVCVWLVYVAGCRFLTRPAALAAALFVAVSPLHVEHSHYATTDVPMVTFLVAALFFELDLLRQPTWRAANFGGLFAGLAVGTKYLGGLGLLGLGVVFLLRRGWREREHWAKFAAAAALVPLVFVGTTPYAILSSREFLFWMLEVGRQSREGWLGLEHAGSGYVFYLKVLWKQAFTPPVALLALGGWVWSWRHGGGARLPALCFLLFYLIIGRPSLMWDRFFLPAIPLLSLAAAVGLQDVLRRWPHGLFPLAALLAVWPVYESYRIGDWLRSPDARLAALEWVEANIPAGSKILSEAYGPPLLKTREEYERELAEIRRTDPNLGNRTEYLMRTETTRPRYELTGLNFLGEAAERDYRDAPSGNWDYVILSRAVYGRFQDAGGKYPMQMMFYAWLEKRGRLLWESADAGRSGKALSIYRVEQPQ